MRLHRVIRHWLTPGWQVRRTFPAKAFAAIETAISAAERSHGGQICFAVEAALETGPLLRGVSARERALEVFSQLRVWDTEQNNGVLIYLLLADHDVEIVADRGISAHVGAAEWERICQTMERAFYDGRFDGGVIEGITLVGAQMALHYPRRGDTANELSNRPVVL